MTDTVSSVMAFSHESVQPPQATVSLSETSLEDSSVTPATPESIYVKDEDDELGERKLTKKRKSWGQELPTPKTNLPPRKRAKTDDEKEQRRIERVLRNRQAAQSSRERKRQEVEKLEGEKQTIEQQNQLLKERLMAVEHEKFLLAQKVAKLTAQVKKGSSNTSDPCSPSLVTEIFDHQRIKQEIDLQYPFFPSTAEPTFTSSNSSFSSPASMTYSPSQSPPSLSLNLDDSSTTSSDMTQHPAVSVRGSTMSSSVIDSAYDSPRCDPIIYDSEEPCFGDVDFGSLFAIDDASHDDLQLFKEGFDASALNNFPSYEPQNDSILNNSVDGMAAFDSLVDFDACQPASLSTTTSADQAHDGERHFGGDLSKGSDSKAQIVATSSAPQPFSGASS